MSQVCRKVAHGVYYSHLHQRIQCYLIDLGSGTKAVEDPIYFVRWAFSFMHRTDCTHATHLPFGIVRFIYFRAKQWSDYKCSFYQSTSLHKVTTT